MDFGKALTALKAGKKVAREGWNGAEMFAFIQPAYSREAKAAEMPIFGAYVYYRECYLLKTAQGDLASWVPSGSDTLAEDWVIV